MGMQPEKLSPEELLFQRATCHVPPSKSSASGLMWQDGNRSPGMGLDARPPGARTGHDTSPSDALGLQ